MKRSAYFLMSVCMLLCTTLNAELIETQDIQDLLKYADEETLVVTDLNEVVIQTPQMLGSAAWMTWDLEHAMNKRKMDKARALEERVPVWHKVMRRTKMELVDPKAPWVYSELQRRGSRVVGLTNNYLELAYVTMGHLKRNAIDFMQKPVYPFDKEITGGRAAKLVDGVIFAGLDNDKGETLLNLLEQIHYTPKRIVFIDDKEKNVTSVLAACEKAGIPCVGLRYGKADERKLAFDPRIAGEQLLHLEKVIADEEAQLLLKAEGSHA